VESERPTDQLRAFSNDPWLMGEVAAIHALGDIWSMGAAPQAALASIILPPMADHLHAAMLDEILTAATNVLRTAGARCAHPDQTSRNRYDISS